VGVGYSNILKNVGVSGWEMGWNFQGELGEAVEAALREALTAEDAERAEMELRGRDLVERSYSWDQIANEVIDACRT